MKKIFIIECNPKEHSAKQEFVDTYIDEAKSLGHEVKKVNVYNIDVSFLKFNGNEMDTSLPDDLKQAQENIVWADQIVFVYSLWCFNIPAALKSFIERTFQCGITWQMGKNGPEPVTKDKTSVIIQSYGMPYFFMKYFLGDIPFKFWQVLLTKWCGFKIVKRFDFDMIDSVPEKRKQKWIKDIKKFVAKL